MENIELIALDIDGTLIDDNLNVSKNTRNIIKDLRDRDIEIALVSGRAHGAAKVIMEQLEMELPIISHNGGKVTLADGQEIKNEKFPIDCVKEAIEYASEHGLHTIAYIDDLFYGTADDEEYIDYSKKLGVEYKIIESLSHIVEDISLLLLYLDRGITREELEKFKSLDCEVTNSIPNALEFIPKGICKAEGLKDLKRYFNISRENILAIGNSFNDLSMLKFAGNGIAMKNSDKLLLENFNIISKYTNNEEGVYRILKEIYY